MNKLITLYFEDDDIEQKVKLVTTVRGNSVKGMISTESPIGKAILGHKVGDRVTIHVNDSYSYDVIIRAVEVGDDNDELRGF
jgi:transcription elongation factor GreA